MIKGGLQGKPNLSSSKETNNLSQSLFGKTRTKKTKETLVSSPSCQVFVVGCLRNGWVKFGGWDSGTIDVTKCDQVNLGSQWRKE